ncbi:MAG: hypothetical protein IAG13_24140 [Deltaproteobacteria bacterium]|nr:hypothetical protein [Nannocystaceae bacterium]
MSAALAALLPLSFTWGLWAFAPALHRDYDGARAVTPRLARLAPPTTAPEREEPVAVPDGEDVPIDEGDAPLPGNEPAEPKPPGPGGPEDARPSDATPDPEAAKDPDALSIDDVFGTEAQHTDVADDPSDAAATGAKDKVKPGAKFGAARSKLAGKFDFRIRVVSSAYYDIHKVEERQFSRQENRLEFRFTYTPDRHLQIVGDIEPVFFGIAQTPELDDLATQRLLTPFHIESDAAYIALLDLVPGLDIKVGRQILQWGTADKFNPTNNINPDDLEDRPLFTEPIANQMVVVDYAPLDNKLWFEGVYVPTFFPALLPPSAAAALKDPQTDVPFASDADVAKLDSLQGYLAGSPMLVPTVIGHVRQPSRRFTTGQSAIKLGTSLSGIDMTMSYYNGRHDIPTAVAVASSNKDPRVGDGTEKECCYQSDVTLIYPRMQVLGLDFTTQLPFLRNMGFWGEGALFFPQKQKLYIEFPISVDVTSGSNDDGIQNPVQSMTGTTIRSTPYIKATTGIDYTFGKHVYVQAQYLRGFIDEFGADHIGNYLVGGTDLIFFGRHFIFRAFGVVDLPTGKGDNASYVIYPELILVPPWGSVTFEVGSFFLLGKPDTKFGQKATGSSIAFFKVVGAF